MTKAQEENKSFFKKFEADIVRWLIGGILSIISAGIIFYFNATNKLSAHEEKFSRIELRVVGLENKIDKIAVDPAINAEQMKAIREMIQEIRDRQQREEERNDKLMQRQDQMYNIMLELEKHK